MAVVRAQAEMAVPLKAKGAAPILNQSDFDLLAGGTIPFIRRYSTICP